MIVIDCFIFQLYVVIDTNVIINDLTFVEELIHQEITGNFWFGLVLYVPVNSYGHVGMVSSQNHTFTWASLTKQLISTSCTYFCL